MASDLEVENGPLRVYTIIVNNNIKNENTNDGVEGYQWLFAVTKMLNNITITHCETGLVAWTRFP
jgi:hypothetical protein